MKKVVKLRRFQRSGSLTRTAKALLDGSCRTRDGLLECCVGSDRGGLGTGSDDVAVLVEAVSGAALRRGRQQLLRRPRLVQGRHRARLCAPVLGHLRRFQLG